MSGMTGVDDEFVVEERFPGSAGMLGLQACTIAASDLGGLDSSSPGEPDGHARLGNKDVLDGFEGSLVSSDELVVDSVADLLADNREEEFDSPDEGEMMNGAAKTETWSEADADEDVDEVEDREVEIDEVEDIDVASGRAKLPLELSEDGTAPVMFNEGLGT